MMTEVGHYRGGHVRRRVVRRKYNNIFLFLFTFRCLFRIGVTEQVLKKKNRYLPQNGTLTVCALHCSSTSGIVSMRKETILYSLITIYAANPIYAITERSVEKSLVDNIRAKKVVTATHLLLSLLDSIPSINRTDHVL